MLLEGKASQEYLDKIKFYMFTKFSQHFCRNRNCVQWLIMVLVNQS